MADDIFEETQELRAPDLHNELTRLRKESRKRPSQKPSKRSKKLRLRSVQQEEISTDEEYEEGYREALAQSAAKQFGPAVMKASEKRANKLFNLRQEASRERVLTVFPLVTEAFKACVDNDVGPLRDLKLSLRRHTLDKKEASRVYSVVMDAVNSAMVAAGFRGLEIPLIEVELLHLRLLFGSRDWDRSTPNNKNLTDPRKDSWYVPLTLLISRSICYQLI